MSTSPLRVTFTLKRPQRGGIEVMDWQPSGTFAGASHRFSHLNAGKHDAKPNHI